MNDVKEKKEAKEVPYIYRNVFFGADREYGPNEGWQRVRNKKRYRKSHVIPNRNSSEAD
jgi:hypothetical protein